ncbi:MAG TPA: hypothetical protein PK963_02295 [Arachnia sp.]|jgi:hypothetical protein|nr:hypothetical protein [Arachnia sp.]
MSALSTQPRPDLLVYHLDSDAETARWVALPPEPDSYTGQISDSGWTSTQFEPSPFHEAGVAVPAGAAPAPVSEQPAPDVTVISDVSAPDGRELAVEITPVAGSYALTIEARSPDGIRAIAVNGEQVPAATTGAPTAVRVAAFSPTSGVPITLLMPDGADVDLALGSYTSGLAGSPATNLRPRPDDLTTGVYELADSVLVTKVVRLPAGAAH